MGMTPHRKAGVVTTGSSKLPVRSSSEPDSSLVSYTPQQLLGRLDGDLEQLSRGLIYTGETGTLGSRYPKES